MKYCTCICVCVGGGGGGVCGCVEGEEGRASSVPQTHQTVAVHSPPTWPGQAGRPGVAAVIVEVKVHTFSIII